MPTILETALALAAAGMPVLPLYGPGDGARGAHGKSPRQREWGTTLNTPENIAYWFRQHPQSNIGLVCGAASGLVCVDIDPRNGGMAWYEEHKAQLEGCITERTGSGGLHLWFRHPGGFIVSTTGKHGLAAGVELKADGGQQCVITPSVHASGALYSCPFDFVTVRDLADPLPEWIRKPIDLPEKRTRRKEVYADNEADIATCRARLGDFAPAVESQEGDKQTLKACMLGRDHDLSEATFLPLIAEWNKRCSPPWPNDDLARKVRNAYNYAKALQPGQAAPTRDFDAVSYVALQATELSPEAAAAQTKELVSWAEELLIDKQGNPKSCENNVNLILRRHELMEGLLRWNLFTGNVEFAANPPWKRAAEPGTEWTEHDDGEFQLWLGRLYKIPWDIAKVSRSIANAAKLNPFHPVTAYLDGLTWDGVPRLDSLLARYFGAEPSLYVSAVGRCMLLAAVARVRRPGCKVDSMPILEGAQGTFKSSALRVLTGDTWFTDAEIDPASKDACLAIRGRWIVEMGELQALRRAEANQLKAWITRQTDRQRDPYARRMGDTHRQCLFVGTTNQAEYLKDDTGNRRFWPVTVGRIDLEALRADRDQLWAEASVLHAGGARWWLTAEEEVLARGEQADRLANDPWESLIATYLQSAKDIDDKPIDKVTANDVIISCLGIDKSRISILDASRVGVVLRKLGWARKSIRISGILTKGFIRPIKADS